MGLRIIKLPECVKNSKEERASQTQSFCNTTLLILSLIALTQPRGLMC